MWRLKDTVGRKKVTYGEAATDLRCEETIDLLVSGGGNQQVNL